MNLHQSMNIEVGITKQITKNRNIFGNADNKDIEGF